MKSVIAVAILLACAGCASTPAQEQLVKLQIENNNTQLLILQSLKQIEAKQKP